MSAIARLAQLEADPRPPGYSDEALALKFAEKHGEDLKFVAGWGKWMVWTGTYWTPDQTLHALDFARAICRTASAEIPPDQRRMAAQVASAKTVAAVEKLARADRRHAATTGEWDSDPWLLNTPGGTVDLRLGVTGPPRREDLITKITSIAPGEGCPLWLGFLKRITDGSSELMRYLQRVAGYALTGSTREHALFFFYGTGANGKGVLIGTLNGIMGDYAKIAAVETFTCSKTAQHPTDLAGLRGARLVTAQETDHGQGWAESKIKAITGGDKIAARFMRQDFFDYFPEFKLVIAGNNKPGLRRVDEAIRRRMNLVPFNVTIPKTERDDDLPKKLEAEWPGILQWMIEGCRQWQQERLSPPEIVRAATDEYLQGEDAIKAWIEEACVTGSYQWGVGAQLWIAGKRGPSATTKDPRRARRLPISWPHTATRRTRAKASAATRALI